MAGIIVKERHVKVQIGMMLAAMGKFASMRATRVKVAKVKFIVVRFTTGQVDQLRSSSHFEVINRLVCPGLDWQEWAYLLHYLG